MSRLWRFIEKHDRVIGKRSKHRFSILIVAANLMGAGMTFMEPWAWMKGVQLWASVNFIWVVRAGALLSIIAAVYYAAHLRCPKCSKAVWYNPILGGRRRVWFWTPWMPDLCSRCGGPVDD